MSVEMANTLHLYQTLASLVLTPAIFAIVLGGFWLFGRALQALRG